MPGLASGGPVRVDPTRSALGTCIESPVDRFDAGCSATSLWSGSVGRCPTCTPRWNGATRDTRQKTSQRAERGRPGSCQSTISQVCRRARSRRLGKTESRRGPNESAQNLDGLRLYFTGAVRLCSGPFLLALNARSRRPTVGRTAVLASEVLGTYRFMTVGSGSKTHAHSSLRTTDSAP